jgi:predicted enzyme related to lactoylglutathione lyase
VIKDMAFVAYSVTDVPRAVAFYRDLIGLKPTSVAGEHWVEFEVGNTTFGIGHGAGIGILPGSQFSATFEVDDLAAMRARLVAGGVQVSEMMHGPKCQSCFVTDPDGNRFALHQHTG